MIFTKIVAIYSSPSAVSNATGTDPLYDAQSALFSYVPCYISYGSFKRYIEPALISLSPIERRISLQQRRADFVTAQCSILFEHAEDSIQARGEFIRMAIYRVQCEQDGLVTRPTLIFDGKITDISSERRDNIYNVSASEWDSGMGVQFPGPAFSRADFPSAPSEIVGMVNRQVIIGRFEFLVPVRQVDRDGYVFYICDPPLSRQPTRVYVGGVPVESSRYRFVTMRTASTGIEYSAVVFDKPLGSIAIGTGPFVAVSGGVGINPSNAIEALVASQGIRIGSTFRDKIRSLNSDFPIYTVFNKQGNGMDIVINRLFPQTPFIPVIQSGFIELVSPDVTGPGVADIRASGAFGFSRTGFRDVVNSVQINCGMTHFGGQATRRPLVQVFFGPSDGPAEIRAIASRSMRLYGPRFLEIDAGDLGVEFDALGRPISSKSGERLASFIIKTSAFESYSIKYCVDYDMFDYLSLGDVVNLYDNTIDANGDKFIVVGKSDGDLPIVTIERVIHS